MDFLALIPPAQPDVTEQLRAELRPVLETLASIVNNLPQSRRPLSESTKGLHLEVVWLKRGGYCPCCQRSLVCDAGGRLTGSEFDHWHSRHRN
jgi:hypothetical protein